MGHRATTVVAATPHFSFHSDFWLNLHTYLYGIAGGGPDERAGYDAEGIGCFDALPAPQLEGWRAAARYYAEHMGERHHRTDRLMRAVRYRLTNLGAEHDADPEIEEVLGLLRAAAPAYRACLWETHDARNRRRIAELVGLLAVHGPGLQAELTRYYAENWPEHLNVDVVSYSDFAGANTASGRTLPPHTMLSSTKPATAGFSGLELVLHEASHAMFGFRWGRVAEEIAAVCEQHGAEPPRNLWHAISFYTSGEAVARVARRAGDAGFEPYAKRRKMFDGPFRGYLEPIESHWQPYLDGQTDMSTAVARLIEAILKPGN